MLLTNAELWVFVLHSFKHNEPDFVIVPREELRKRLSTLQGWDGTIQSYLCSTEDGVCWEARIQRHTSVLRQIAEGSYEEPKRDFTKYLNNWDAVMKQLKVA